MSAKGPPECEYRSAPREGIPMIGTGAETVWERGRFDARGGPGKVLFGRMYEDASI